MQAKTPQPDKSDVVALEALNELIEAHLDMLGSKEARAYLRALAARIAAKAPSGPVVGLHDATSKATQVWLQERLSVWLARHG